MIFSPDSAGQKNAATSPKNSSSAADEARAEDHAGLVVYDGADDAGVFSGVVFEVGVLDDDHRCGDLPRRCAQRGALALVAHVAVDAHARLREHPRGHGRDGGRLVIHRHEHRQRRRGILLSAPFHRGTIRPGKVDFRRGAWELTLPDDENLSCQVHFQVVAVLFVDFSALWPGAKTGGC